MTVSRKQQQFSSLYNGRRLEITPMRLAGHAVMKPMGSLAVVAGWIKRARGHHTTWRKTL